MWCWVAANWWCLLEWACTCPSQPCTTQRASGRIPWPSPQSASWRYAALLAYIASILQSCRMCVEREGNTQSQCCAVHIPQMHPALICVPCPAVLFTASRLLCIITGSGSRRNRAIVPHHLVCFGNTVAKLYSSWGALFHFGALASTDYCAMQCIIMPDVLSYPCREKGTACKRPLRDYY